MTDTTFSAIRARLRYQTVDEFIEGYSRYITSSGMFVPMAPNKLKPVGSTVRFQFLLGDGKTTALLGEGVVRQIRGLESGEEGTPVGMLVRFSKLSQESKHLVERIVALKADGNLAGGLSAAEEESNVAMADDDRRPSRAATRATTPSGMFKPASVPANVQDAPTGSYKIDDELIAAAALRFGDEASEVAEAPGDDDTGQAPDAQEVANLLAGEIGFDDGDADKTQEATLGDFLRMHAALMEDSVSRNDAFDEPDQAEPESGHDLFDEALDSGLDLFRFDSAPADDEPVVEEPAAEAPVVDEPVVDEPVVEEPAAEAPVVDEPVVDEPVASEQPAGEEAVAAASAVEEPPALRQTEAGLKVLAFDGHVDEDVVREFDAFAAGGDEDDVDDMFDNIFGGGGDDDDAFGGLFGDDDAAEPEEVADAAESDELELEAVEPAEEVEPELAFDLDSDDEAPDAALHDEDVAQDDVALELEEFDAGIDIGDADDDGALPFDLGFDDDIFDEVQEPDADAELESVFAPDEDDDAQDEEAVAEQADGEVIEALDDEDDEDDVFGDDGLADFGLPEFSVPSESLSSASELSFSEIDEVGDDVVEEAGQSGPALPPPPAPPAPAPPAPVASATSPGASDELLGLLGSLTGEASEPVDDGDEEFSLNLGGIESEPEAVEPDSLDALLAAAQKDLEAKKATDEEKPRDILDELLGDDELPPPPPPVTPFSMPEPREKKKGFMAKLFGKD